MRTLATTLAALALTASLTGCGADPDNAAADVEDPRSSADAAARAYLAAVVDEDWEAACDQYLASGSETPMSRDDEDYADCLQFHKDVLLERMPRTEWEAAQAAAADGKVVVDDYDGGKAVQFGGPGSAGVDVSVKRVDGGWWVDYGDVKIDED